MLQQEINEDNWYRRQAISLTVAIKIAEKEVCKNKSNKCDMTN